MTDATTTLTTTIVPDDERLSFLPKMFFSHLAGEQYVYLFAERFSFDYKKGYWEYVDVSNGAKFMYPKDGMPNMRVETWGNGYEAEVTPEAFGIITSLYALTLVIEKTQDERIYDVYERLREYVFVHPECHEILRAID